MQILYQRCEFSSDMLSEYEIRQRIGFNYSLIGGILQCCVRNNILPAETNIEMILIVLHSAFSGLIKTGCSIRNASIFISRRLRWWII